MATGETYVLLDHQRTTTIPHILNRYYYQMVSGDGDSATDLALAFIQHVLPTILLIQNLDVEHTSIEVYTPDDVGDFVSMPLTADNIGLGTGERLPDFVSWTFKYHRPFRSFRNGRKAFVGVSENNQGNGVPTPAMEPFLADVATVLAETIAPTGVSKDFAPVLVKNLVPVPPLIREVAQVMTVSFSRISTQSTRKS